MNKTFEEIIKKDLMQLMGLEHLSEEKKAELYKKALETIQNRVLIRIASNLREKDKEAFFKLIDAQDDKKIDDFLQSKNVDYQSIFGEEVLLYKLEMSKKTQVAK